MAEQHEGSTTIAGQLDGLGQSRADIQGAQPSARLVALPAPKRPLARQQVSSPMQTGVESSLHIPSSRARKSAPHSFNITLLVVIILVHSYKLLTVIILVRSYKLLTVITLIWR